MLLFALGSPIAVFYYGRFLLLPPVTSSSILLHWGVLFTFSTPVCTSFISPAPCRLKPFLHQGITGIPLHDIRDKLRYIPDYDPFLAIATYLVAVIDPPQ
jgi:hypothetical protein